VGVAEQNIGGQLIVTLVLLVLVLIAVILLANLIGAIHVVG
jgi:hypothetical protein